QTIYPPAAAHPVPSAFFVPGAPSAPGAIDLARTMVRRAERRAVAARESGSPSQKPARHTSPVLRTYCMSLPEWPPAKTKNPPATSRDGQLRAAAGILAPSVV